MKFNWIILLILLSSIVNAQEIQLGNKTIEVISLINESVCENTTNVFKIINLNYNTGDKDTTINYTQTWNNQSVNIFKEIKKYSKTNTGQINNIENKENKLQFILNNQTIEWIINSSCHKKNETKTNNTINISETINKSENLQNESTQPKENTTQNIKSKEELNVNINKNVFFEGEKISFSFINNTKPVTYWIEDSKGEIIKDKYTTTNDKQKSYTFKEQEGNEKIYFLISKTDNEEKKILLGVTKSIEKNKESEIQINKANFEDEKINIEIEIYRGNTKKTTVYCYTKTNEKKSSEETKLKISSTNSKIIMSMTIYPKNKWKNETEIVCEGLDAQRTIEIKTPQEEVKEKITINKTKEKVKPKVEYPKIKKTINTSSIIKKKENIITGKTIAYNKNSQKDKTSTAIILTALISVFLGGFMTYGPKKIIDKFIKK